MRTLTATIDKVEIISRNSENFAEVYGDQTTGTLFPLGFYKNPEKKVFKIPAHHSVLVITQKSASTQLLTQIQPTLDNYVDEIYAQLAHDLTTLEENKTEIIETLNEQLIQGRNEFVFYPYYLDEASAHERLRLQLDTVGIMAIDRSATPEEVAETWQPRDYDMDRLEFRSALNYASFYEGLSFFEKRKREVPDVNPDDTFWSWKKRKDKKLFAAFPKMLNLKRFSENGKFFFSDYSINTHNLTGRAIGVKKEYLAFDPALMFLPMVQEYIIKDSDENVLDEGKIVISGSGWIDKFMEIMNEAPGKDMNISFTRIQDARDYMGGEWTDMKWVSQVKVGSRGRTVPLDCQLRIADQHGDSCNWFLMKVNG